MEETGRPLDPQELLSHREWIRGLARRLVGDEHTAEDVVQDTMATALTRRPPVLRSLRGWLGTVARSRAIDRRRSDSARAAREQLTRPSVAPSTADLVARADAQRAVAAAVMELAEPYRTTVLLRHFEELTPTQIGERTCVPRETVKTRLRRANVMLREKLDAEFGGERDRWRAALVPLLLGPPAAPLPDPSPARPGIPTATATTVAVTTVGALLMSAKIKVALLAAAVLLLLAGGVAVTVLQDDPGEAAPAPGPTPVATHVADEVDAELDVATEPRTLVGRVRRRSDGAPVTNVSVSIRPRRGRAVHARTASDGSFTLETPGGVVGRVTVAAVGYAQETVSLPDASDDFGTIWVAAGTRIVIRVEDEDGVPVSGVSLVGMRWRPHGDRAHVDSYLMGMTARSDAVVERRNVVSDVRGEAIIADARAGSWHVVASGPDVGSKRSEYVAVHPGTAEAHVTLVVVPLVSLSGRVIDSAGAPVPSALMCIEGSASVAGLRRTRTDAGGRFQIDGLPAGTLSVTVDLCGDGPGTKLAVVRVPDVRTIELVLPSTGRLEGRVTDADGGPLPGEVVRIEIDGAVDTLTTATTDADGRYEFAALPEGRVARFRVFSSQRVQLWPRFERGELLTPGPDGTGEPSRRRARIVAGATTSIDAVLVPGGVVAGIVTGPDGPLAGVQIWRHRKPTRAGSNWAGTTTDDAGRYHFPPDLPGVVAVQVRHPEFYQPGLPQDVSGALRDGLVPEQFLIQIPEAGDVRLDLVVVRGGRVHGRVEDEGGEPVADARLSFGSAYSDPFGRTVSTDANGAFVFDDARPGTQRLLQAVTDDGSARGTVKVDVLPEGVADAVVVRVKRSAGAPVDGEVHEVAGRVLFASSGRPVTDARIVLLRREPVIVNGLRMYKEASNAPIVAISDDDGRFRCNVIGDGPFWLAAESALAIEAITRVASDFGDVDIRALRSLAVSGHVRETGGGPAVGASVVAVPKPAGAPGVTIAPWLRTEGLAFSTRTHRDGSFTIRGVPEGRCKIMVFRVSELQPPAHAAGTSFGPFEAGASGLDLRLDRPQRASLRLHVIYPDGSPVARGKVQYVPEGSYSSRFINFEESDGRVTIPGAADPSYVVRVSAYTEPRTVRVFRGLAPGETVHELVLTPGATIAGTVLDDAGAPLAGIPMTARRRGAFDRVSMYSTQAGTDGTFVFTDLESGTYEIQPRGPAEGRWRRMVALLVVDSGAGGVQVRTTIEGRVRGVVVDSDGAPVSGLRIHFYRPPEAVSWGTVPQTITDDAGRFAMTGLDPAGQWDVEPQVDVRNGRSRYDLRTKVRVGDLDVRIVVPAKD